MKVPIAVVFILLLATPTVAQTFNRDVMPILQQHCQTCHRQGEIGPMPLMSYEEVRPWAKSIRLRVLNGSMPPWHADPHYGPFENDRRLSSKEIETIVSWVDAGGPQGDPRDLPAPRKFPEGWKIGKPDVVLKMTESYTVGAAGLDEYIYFVIPTNFTEDRYVRAVEVRPGNRSVVHHVLAYIQPGGNGIPSRAVVENYNRIVGSSLFRGEGFAIRVNDDAPIHDDGCVLSNGGSALGGDMSSGRRPLIGAYVPGRDPSVMPSGIAQKIPAGSEILLQIHYAKNGKQEIDQTSVGLLFSNEPPKDELKIRWVQNYYFRIPPNSANHEVRGCYTFNTDVDVLSFAPHMHLRGKDMEFKATYPDGHSEILFKVPSYDFNWQTTYVLKEPRRIPRGAKIEVIAHYDNTGKNRSNPNPDATVRWGDPTYDEMMIGGMNYVVVRR